MSIESKTWRDLARDVFSVSPDRLTADAVLRKVVDTDTCDNPVNPVEIWIDREGFYSVLVHDAANAGA